MDYDIIGCISYHGLYHIIHDIDNDMKYDIIGQTYDLAGCRIIILSP
jgi:hypothetical protein